MNANTYNDIYNATCTCIGTIDVIRNSLSTSVTAYDAAGAGDIITVTESEYNTLVSNLANTVVGAVPPISPVQQLASNIVISNNVSAYPANHYVVAFRAYVAVFGNGRANMQFRRTYDAGNNFFWQLPFSNSFSITAPAGLRWSYHVMKSPTWLTIANNTKFAIYFPIGTTTDGVNPIARLNTGTSGYYADGPPPNNVQGLPTASNYEILLSVITSGTKQWQ